MKQLERNELDHRFSMFIKEQNDNYRMTRGDSTKKSRKLLSVIPPNDNHWSGMLQRPITPKNFFTSTKVDKDADAKRSYQFLADMTTSERELTNQINKEIRLNELHEDRIKNRETLHQN